jgi:protein SCO1
MLRALVFLALLVGANPSLAAGSLPFDVGGAYSLTDQNGQTRSQIDPDGRAQLLFFGYANCPGICPTAFATMADTVDRLADQGIPVRPILITVDPSRDTVANMGAPLARLHPDFVGLTGSEAALARAYKAFGIESKVEYTDPEKGAIYSHGSFIYLLDAQGEVLTLLPPILHTDRMVEIVRGYLVPKE